MSSACVMHFFVLYRQSAMVTQYNKWIYFHDPRFLDIIHGKYSQATVNVP